MSPQHFSFHNTLFCGRENERITNTLFFMNLSLMSCERITDVKNSCESFTEVKESYAFVTSVKNSHEFFTGVTNTFEFFTLVTDSFDFHIRTNLSHVWRIRTYLSQLWKIWSVTNTCEFFTRIKLDICEKLVPIKISKLVVRKCQHIPKCDVFMRIIHSVWKIRSVNIKVQQSTKQNSYIIWIFPVSQI